MTEREAKLTKQLEEYTEELKKWDDRMPEGDDEYSRWQFLRTRSKFIRLLLEDKVPDEPRIKGTHVVKVPWVFESMIFYYYVALSASEIEILDSVPEVHWDMNYDDRQAVCQRALQMYVDSL